MAGLVRFNYGQSYLLRPDAIPLYLPELPLRAGIIEPVAGLTIPGSIRDAAPDAWGQRVVMQHLLGAQAKGGDPAAFGPLTYLLHSGSDRIGALDFQDRADVYVGRDQMTAPLEDLMTAADLVDEGLPLSPALDLALLHRSVVKGEYAAMELARRAGLTAAGVEIRRVMSRDVLLVARFDRAPGTRTRRAMVSALTILELDELMARYASYADLAQIVLERFTDGRRTLRELFARLAVAARRARA